MNHTQDRAVPGQDAAIVIVFPTTPRHLAEFDHIDPKVRAQALAQALEELQEWLRWHPVPGRLQWATASDRQLGAWYANWTGQRVDRENVLGPGTALKTARKWYTERRAWLIARTREVAETISPQAFQSRVGGKSDRVAPAGLSSDARGGDIPARTKQRPPSQLIPGAAV